MIYTEVISSVRKAENGGIVVAPTQTSRNHACATKAEYVYTSKDAAIKAAQKLLGVELLAGLVDSPQSKANKS